MASLQRLLEPHPRIRTLCEGAPNSDGRCIIYWMQHAQRAEVNPALNLAIALGNALELPILAVFGLTADYPGAQRRHYRFLVDALPEIERTLRGRGVRFVLRIGPPDEVVIKLVQETQPAILIGDENPVRFGQQWRNQVAETIEVPFRCVDADVVVPTSHFPKQEFAARTIRPKIHKLWDQYLKAKPDINAQTSWQGRKIPEGEAIEPDALLSALNVGGASEVLGYRGGTDEAKRRLSEFVEHRLPQYNEDRNQPTQAMTSELSAHLHFGHISPIAVALAVKESQAPQNHIDAYLEQLIVRRELAINYVARNPNYDRLDGCPDWALKTLADHAQDERPYLYTPEQLEAAETHDPLWNAAQKEMVVTGRMHNYLRMYWAKKILEWSPDAESAFEIAIDLNDRYEMDGRDPNGYVGVAWAIGGTHDRPWPERPIFGKIRFMSYNSTRKKFDAQGYIDQVTQIEQQKSFDFE